MWFEYATFEREQLGLKGKGAIVRSSYKVLRLFAQDDSLFQQGLDNDSKEDDGVDSDDGEEGVDLYKVGPSVVESNAIPPSVVPKGCKLARLSKKQGKKDVEGVGVAVVAEGGGADSYDIDELIIRIQVDFPLFVPEGTKLGCCGSEQDIEDGDMEVDNISLSGGTLGSRADFKVLFPEIPLPKFLKFLLKDQVSDPFGWLNIDDNVRFPKDFDKYFPGIKFSKDGDKQCGTDLQLAVGREVSPLYTYGSRDKGDPMFISSSNESDL